MNTSIAVALISGLCVAIPSLVTTIVTNNAFQKLVSYRLDLLDGKVTKHNEVIERTYKLEQNQAVLEERISNLEK